METNIAIDLKEALKLGVVKFKYTKRDGSERLAVGTTNIEDIPTESHPSGSFRNTSDEIIRYYDLTSEGWRSCLKSNIISIEEQYSSLEEYNSECKNES